MKICFRNLLCVKLICILLLAYVEPILSVRQRQFLVLLKRQAANDHTVSIASPDARCWRRRKLTAEPTPNLLHEGQPGQQRYPCIVFAFVRLVHTDAKGEKTLQWLF